MVKKIVPLSEMGVARNIKDPQPLIEEANYSETYDYMLHDLVSESASDDERGDADVPKPGTEARVFTAEELGLKPNGEMKDRNDVVFEVNQAIEWFDSERPWRPGSLGHLIAFEARYHDRHEQPLFATAIMFSHNLGHGLITDGCPAVLQDGDGRRLVFLVTGGATFQKLDDASMLFAGHFLAVR